MIESSEQHFIKKKKVSEASDISLLPDLLKKLSNAPKGEDEKSSYEKRLKRLEKAFENQKKKSKGDASKFFSAIFLLFVLFASTGFVTVRVIEKQNPSKEFVEEHAFFKKTGLLNIFEQYFLKHQNSLKNQFFFEKKRKI